jgi:hypothetical protein
MKPSVEEMEGVAMISGSQDLIRPAASKRVEIARNEDGDGLAEIGTGGDLMNELE